MLATLSAGETIGEVEIVLCRKANADAIALQPTVTLFLSREDFARLVVDHPALVHGLYLSAVRRENETAQAMESAAFTTNDYQLDEILVEESLASEETRLDGAAYHETTARAEALAEEPEPPAAPQAIAISVPPALPPVSSPADPPARVTAVTAPFPPVLAAPPGIEEAPANSVAVVTAVLPPPPSVLAPSTGAVPTKMASVRATVPLPPHGAVPRFSSMSPVMASKPPAGSVPAAASRARPFWDLPPVAVFGVFAAVAVVGFALAAPFSNHLNTAAASGGGVQNAPVPMEAPVEPPSPPAPENPPVAIAPVAPPPPVAAPVASVKAAIPSTRPRAVAVVRARAVTPPTDVDSTSEDSAAAPKAARPAPQPADEFGGRE
jgi:hypothetical protein